MKKFAKVVLLISLLASSPQEPLWANEVCDGGNSEVACIQDEGMSIWTKILIGVLVYAILATLLYQQGGDGTNFDASPESS